MTGHPPPSGQLSPALDSRTRSAQGRDRHPRPADNRLAYMHAVWESRDGEADYHRTRVDDLLALWSTIRTGQVLAAHVKDAP